MDKRVAYMEEAEEDTGSSIEGKQGTRTYARSDAPESPGKVQRSNTSKSREKRMSPKASPPSTGSSPTDSEAPIRSRKDKAVTFGVAEDRERERHRRERQMLQHQQQMEDDARAKAQEKSRRARPSHLRHSLTQPIVEQSAYRRGHMDDPRAYAIQQPAVSGPRPRGHTRPVSYSGVPPLQTQPPGGDWRFLPSPAPPGAFPMGSFPPPPPQFYGHGMHPMMQPPPPPSPRGPPSYFEPSPNSPMDDYKLRQRFEPRPASAQGQGRPGARPHEFSQYGSYEESAASTLARRPSRSRPHDEDKRRMPPPEKPQMRPRSAMPRTGQPFAPPPPAPRAEKQLRTPSRPPLSHRGSYGYGQDAYEDEDFHGQDELFQDCSPQPVFDSRPAVQSRLRRDSVLYDDGDEEYGLVPANNYGRRNSVYEHQGAGAAYTRKMSEALRYQEGVSPQLPLTAESLAKANKRAGAESSRSTHSSASRDDSEFKRSNTTGLTGMTRSSSGNQDDYTICFNGPGILRVTATGATEIECNDGGQITYSRGGQGELRSAERGAAAYQIEDVRSRREQKALPYRARAPSQSDSQSRYTPTEAPYDPTFSHTHWL